MSADLTSWSRRVSTETSATPAAYGEDLDEIAERYALNRGRLSERETDRLREQLIGELLPFAGRLAGRYRNSREPAADLEQVARVGLVKAVNRYDPDRGSFTAFAVATITGELKRYFRDNTWGVHVPRRMQDLALSVTQAESALTAELGRRPTDVEVARRCRVSIADVMDARRSAAGYIPVSFSVPVGESGQQLGDLLGASDYAVDLVPDQVTLHGLIDRLPARERRILLERYYGSRSQAEIAAGLGISQMHVSRLLSRTLEWLRAAMLGDQVPSWPTGCAVEPGPVVTVRRNESGVLRVFVAGEIDRDNAQRLRQSLFELIHRSRAGSRLVLDLAGVPLIDAAGLAVLMNAYDTAQARHIALTAVRMQPFVRQLAAITGFGALLVKS
jgi:RNA polymerase sigma-B factor